MKTTNTKIKTNIKLRVNPEQSKKIQEICITYGIFWRSNSISSNFFSTKPFLYITKDRIQWGTSEEVFLEKELEEIDPELFIRTNGTCADTAEEIAERYNISEYMSKPNLKIRDEFIYKVQNEKIGVICNTFEELEAWYTFLDKHMDKSLRRKNPEAYSTEVKIGKVVANNTEFGAIAEYDNKGFYESRGYIVYDFKGIVEDCLLSDELEEVLEEEVNKHFPKKEINKEPKEPKEYLVYVEGQKAPKVIHTDIDSAKEEAKRLAKKITSLRKQTFKVYVVEVKAKFQSEIIVNEID